jgi:hypothetical protein
MQPSRASTPGATGRRVIETRCLNCEAVLNGDWCGRCGQRHRPVDPSWGEIVHEAADELLHVDGKVARTLRLLITRPGELTAEVLRGRRAPYVSPLRLYLTASLVYFLLGAVLPNADFNVETIDATPDEQVGLTIAAIERILAMVPRAIFALVPVFAFLVKLTHRHLPWKYPAFLFFALHTHAAFFTIMTLTVPLQMFASDIWISAAQLAVCLGMVAYLGVALRRVGGGTLMQTFGRAVAITSIHAVVFIATLVGLWFAFK